MEFLTDMFFIFYRMMEPKDDEKFNPWDVADLDIYLKYCCPECDSQHETKDFFVDHALLEHPKAGEVPMILQINKNGRYHCDKCEKSYTRKDKLKQHIETVHELVQYNCEKCEKSFTQKNRLNRHIKQVHQTVEPDIKTEEFEIEDKLEFVDADFEPKVEKVDVFEDLPSDNLDMNDSDILKQTQVIEEENNADIQPMQSKTIWTARYTCDKCDKGFCTRGSLNTHIQRIHEHVEYNCEKCEKSYSSKRNLVKHIQSVHEKVEPDIKTEPEPNTDNSLKRKSEAVDSDDQLKDPLSLVPEKKLKQNDLEHSLLTDLPKENKLLCDA